MSSERKKILCWAGWYRHSTDDYKAIFVKKHLEIISKIADIHCFHIYHQKNTLSFKKYTLHESFGDVYIYQIPNFFPFKILGYLLIPVLEVFQAKKKYKSIDIFHLHVSYPFAAFTIFLRLFNIKKWVLTEHWSGYTYFDNHYQKINFIFKFLIQKFLRKSCKISVVSLFLQNEMLKRFPYIKDKILITNNVIQIPTHLSKETNIYQQTFKLLSISNLIDYPKNISFLLEVIYEISQKIPITLDIYGDGQDKNVLLEKARDLNILDKIVFFKGKVQNEKISEIYSQYHAFILLSKFETFSIVTAEAIAHGLPVIVTKCGGPEEYVNSNNGYLVSINNKEETIQAILDLYQNYSKFTPQKVQQTILNKFNENAIIQQFQKLYE